MRPEIEGVQLMLNTLHRTAGEVHTGDQSKRCIQRADECAYVPGTLFCTPRILFVRQRAQIVVYRLGYAYRGAFLPQDVLI